MQGIQDKPKNAWAKKLGLGIALSLLIIAGVALIWWNTHKKKIIRNEIEKAIAKKSNGLYSIKYDSLGIDEVAGYMSINNMKIVFDSLKYDSLKKISSAPSVLLKINIPAISISGVKTPKALISKEIVAGKLKVINPVVEIFYTHAGKDSSRYIPPKEIYEQILGDLNMIKIDSTELINARIITKSIKGKDSVVFMNTNILLTDVIVDSTSNADTTRLLFSKQIGFACENISWSDASGFYKYAVNQLKFNSIDKDLTIDHINIIPRLNEDAFVKAMRYQTDRFDIDLNDIRIQNVNTKELMNEILLAEKLIVKSGSLKVYRDLNIPRDHKNRSGTYPHQQVSEVPIPFIIPHATFSNIFIQYRERNDITKRVGDVRFYNCFLTINNITNEPSALRKNNICRVDMSGNLLNLIPMKAMLSLYLEDKEGKFSIEGSGSSVAATNLNQLTEPMGLATIRKGNLKSIDFKLVGNNYRTDGTVKVLYNDLKVDFLELDDEMQMNKKHLTSFISNIVLKNENPHNGETRIGEVHHERDMNRSFYNLVWKSIFEGINKTIGNKKKMKRP